MSETFDARTFDARQTRADLREDLRAALLAAAARILSEEGLGALTVRHLAEKVNVSTKAVYTLFGGKEGLLEALYRDAFDGIATHLPDVAAIEPASHRLIMLARGYRLYALARPDFYAVMFGDAGTGFSPSAESRRHAWNTTRPMRQTLAACRPGMRAAEADFIMRALWAVMHGVVSLELRQLIGGREMAERLFDDTMLAVLARHGIAVPPEALALRPSPRGG
ncbi:TetR/AcrR family transcriptional regulator [Zavarzinia compransoris]|uniref:TetR family transcriptional regulator n=1 Tax=Zavarzinia compransoris TaxID=1264899 RepID=A0A317E7J8_9PROT|nr:TetR/AcrR family transcriptional regulator [Zavarzinia compransoris]PWR23037.1 TetR family transcriptional regulator [Zavarzinia compransoris]TDP46418.1 TetR family transcriptional regulator [Zavarzinia compransoris]